MKKNNSSEDIFSFENIANRENTKNDSVLVNIEAGTFSETDIDHIEWPKVFNLSVTTLSPTAAIWKPW